MSGIHFEVENLGEYAEIRDQRSTNKTWLNNQVISTSRLSSGDMIRAGKTFFAVEWECPVAAKPFAREPSHSRKNSEDLRNDSEESAQSKHGSDSRSPIGSISSSYFKQPSPSHFSSDSGPSIESPKPRSFADFPLSFADSHVAYGDDSNPSGKQKSVSDSQVSSFGSPLDSSSVFISSNSGNGAKGSDLSENRLGVKRLKQDKTISTHGDIAKLIAQLSEIESVCVVVHFRKIGATTPSDLRASPVFPEIKSIEHMPVIVQAKDWLGHPARQLSARLLDADGILVVVKSDLASDMTSIHELSRRAVPGFSEPDGFLGWCWPSQMHSISNHISDANIADLMGESIRGFVFGSQTTEKSLIAVAKMNLLESLERCGFR